MRILLAAPDRDLLRCYNIILDEAFGETVTAFDGTHVLALLADTDFDLCILDRDLPRVGHAEIRKKLAEKGIPAIVLTNGDAEQDASPEALPEALVLPFPFSPDEMRAAVRLATEKGTEPVNDHE